MPLIQIHQKCKIPRCVGNFSVNMRNMRNSYQLDVWSKTVGHAAVMRILQLDGEEKLSEKRTKEYSSMGWEICWSRTSP